MDTTLLEKLTNNINQEYSSKFSIDKIKELKFIPLNLQSNVFYVATLNTASKEEITSYIKTVLETEVKFIYLSKDNFDEMLKIYFKTVGHIDETAEDSPELEEEPTLEILPDEEIDLSVPTDVLSPVDNHSDDELKVESNVKGKKIKKVVENASKKKIGEILLEEGLLNDQQLSIALAESKVLGIPLGSVLVKLGFVSIDDLKEALSAQQGMEFVSNEQLKVQQKVIGILPEDFVKLNKVVPISSTDKNLVVGMVNPGDVKVLNEIVYLTGLRPTVMMITHYEYENFVNTYYHNTGRETNQIMRELEMESSENENEDSLWEQVEKEIQDTTGSVSKFANKIITNAIDLKASDIHIEPRLDGYIVRYRIDGILREVLKIPIRVDSSVISRFKVLARMNIAEHRRAQDGNFTIKYRQAPYDFRVNTLPVAGKEKMVIRILPPVIAESKAKVEIEIAGASQEDIEKIKVMAKSPNGIILTSGPTGSGKTTTLYSLIRSLNEESVNITTIEDPVEIKLDGVNQSQVNPKAGITFASSMRAILRQDPDIILVGEIRDFETLEVAISASLTGHLVLSTIHTNSAASTVTRLIEMGAKDYLVASTLTGVLAQRLVRTLCPHCKEAYTPSLDEAKRVTANPVEIETLTKSTIYKQRGCEQCEYSGYFGRTGVFEVLPITKEIKKLIAQRAHDIEIEEAAIRNGMRTLRMACLDHIKNGVTTTDEFVRVLGFVTE